jgi:hypothetical protein
MTTAAERWRWRLTVLVAVAIVVGAVLMQYGTVAGSVTGSRADYRADACLPGTAVPILDSPHIGQDQAADVEYDSVPPTSGPHYAFAANTGIYDSPVAAASFVHTMEHGHVVIAYAADLPAAEVDDLEDLTRRHGDDVLLTPYPDLDHGLALAAWGRLETLDHVDDTTVLAFVNAFADRYDHGWTRASCPGD